ncbi:ATP-binding protein [Halomonas vilamensis]|uniref:histidine kinase n=1 Tax=Vreelandella vilamensis TaxID=531309 RepID=A0ABU1H1M3_9GAMM|nr:ATP-binding protein [Halomonas vilamensis]MDR5897662.1 ATP-binding protein [Halomonas vilamensis]
MQNRSVPSSQVLIDEERAQAHLLQSEKLASIGQLAAGVAHEINNPVGYVFSNLSTLAGYVQELIKLIDAIDSTASLDELKQFKQSSDYDYIRSDVQDLIRESEEGIERVKLIISALKDFSHIEEDAFTYADLHRGIETTLNLVNNELKYKADVEKEFAELPEVECLPSQVNQVVLNLLTNAVHAIENRGTIYLRTGCEGEYVWFEVEDTGKGIEQAQLAHLFEPFYTTKPMGEGTGLGLSLSYSIVTKHSGDIQVFSEPGEGTRFRVWLPIQQSACPQEVVE